MNPSNDYAAPTTELEERAMGVGGYRHGAPTELFNAVHGRNAHVLNVEAANERPTKCGSALVNDLGPELWGTAASEARHFELATKAASRFACPRTP
jgi:hypothetical protein